MPDGSTNAPATSGSGNKMWYIIGGIVILLLLGWVLMRGAPSMMGAAGVNTDRNTDGSTTYSNSEGSVTVGATSMPDNWPSDAPAIYSGGTIQYSGSSNPQTGQAGSVVVYSAKATVSSVVEYYKAQLAQAGWTLEGTANSAGTTIISAKKDTRTFGISVADTGTGTVQVTAGIGM
ncbi:hypothetical protein A2851_01065 [Candidatus Kaiserbacteria bacterium RIFCSPHIGHO2_01_FULL_53_29]|uniref:Uncharacterized protein n=2 Tax=Candidatus Kaiseribacteriota TaxID=1752734 RepID=A0A1F6CYY1_9BACT|nr:MAG: hypothetical protein A2851_01065 [Candidatus Kaiserbacteria bacterium RIFCSPHIGHO2_01_FULL_53_29]